MENIVMEEIEIYIALGVIWRPDLRSEIRCEILVQCTEEKDFYCLPGGKIRLGEHSLQAFHREMEEQYSFKLRYYGTFMEFEMPPPVRCKYIFHKCMLDDESRWDSDRTEYIEFPHNNYKDIKLVWCSIDNLYNKLAYPNSLLRPLIEKLKTDDEGYIYASGYE
jgi:8-oxo-dGTP pyrophosphatase MutT (NUDIX family)